MPTDSRFVKVDGSFERVVKPGDTLSGIAAERGVDLSSLLAANPQYKANPNLIRPGEKVIFGATPGATPTPTTPAAPVLNPGSTPSATTTANPMDSFNLLLTGMLKEAQGVTTADFLAKKRALERATLGKASEMTPEELRTLSPAQQNAIRTGEVSALRPEIDANAADLERAEQQIDNFFKVHAAAQKIGSDFAEKMVAPEAVINAAKFAIESDPSKLSTILAGFNDKSKQAIIQALDYTKIKEKPIEVSAGASLYDPQTGERIFTAPKVATPGSSSGVTIKPTTTQVTKLSGLGLSKDDINALIADANATSVDEAVAGLPANLQKQAREILGGKTTAANTTSVINEQYLRNRLSVPVSEAKMLEALGKDRSEYSKLFQSKATETAAIKADYKAYTEELIKAFLPQIKTYQDAGMSDEEIIKLLK